MSHIAKQTREALLLHPVGKCPMLNGSELSFVMMSLLTQYVGNNPAYYNEALGAIERAKNELYRRHIKPFEEQQRFENGDVN